MILIAAARTCTLVWSLNAPTDARPVSLPQPFLTVCPETLHGSLLPRPNRPAFRRSAPSSRLLSHMIKGSRHEVSTMRDGKLQGVFNAVSLVSDVSQRFGKGESVCIRRVSAGYAGLLTRAPRRSGALVRFRDKRDNVIAAARPDK